jgi:16S rRNA (guanine527-N7)-methyltransferase
VSVVPAVVATPAQRRLLERHLDELEIWNRRLNLTTVPRDKAWERHVVESLRLLWVAGVVPGSRCVDIGSGAGFPGITIAIVRPDVSMTLVESDRRKAGFLTHVAGLLGLHNVIVAARRAEEMAGDGDHRAAYDVAVSRAAAPPRPLVELALPLLRDRGMLWALVSEAEVAADGLRARGLRATAPAPGILLVEKLAPPPARPQRPGARPTAG